ncbi:YqjD family protein [Xenorhabdus sp. XENO-7]|uniref:YqjD family protein n=1 Tax=Xenorhabdus aichiensis TaxID=3025874 RepID=A0ABT5M6J4_9GAMM|nr:YqjD family protein [Xenorhabdus aichiensis]MDC9623326.1 YqjD family protein [Xenorhabdus aichiensis]
MPQKKNSEDLRTELQSLADTLEEVLNSSGDKSKAELEKLRSKAEKTLKDARVTLSDASDKLVDQTKEIAGRADNYVRDNPWTSIGIGAAVGAVLGILLAKR